MPEPLGSLVLISPQSPMEHRAGNSVCAKGVIPMWCSAWRCFLVENRHYGRSCGLASSLAALAYGELKAASKYDGLSATHRESRFASALFDR